MMKRYVYKFPVDEREMIYKLFDNIGLSAQIYKRSSTQLYPLQSDADNRLETVSEDLETSFKKLKQNFYLSKFCTCLI